MLCLQGGCGILPSGFCLFHAVGSWLSVRGREGRDAGGLRDGRTSKGRRPLDKIRTEVGVGLTCCLSSSLSLCAGHSKGGYASVLAAFCPVQPQGNRVSEQSVRLEPAMIPLWLSAVRWK